MEKHLFEFIRACLRMVKTFEAHRPKIRSEVTWAKRAPTELLTTKNTPAGEPDNER